MSKRATVDLTKSPQKEPQNVSGPVHTLIAPRGSITWRLVGRRARRRDDVRVTSEEWRVVGEANLMVWQNPQKDGWWTWTVMETWSFFDLGFLIIFLTVTTNVGSASRPLRGSGRACLDRCGLLDFCMFAGLLLQAGTRGLSRDAWIGRKKNNGRKGIYFMHVRDGWMGG